jgi:hypothetical protein
MARVMQLYGLSANDALKLSDAHVQLMVEHAEQQAASLLQGSAALQQKLAPMKRTVRAMLDDEGGDGSVGAPPSL